MPTPGQQTSEHKLSTLAVILIAAGAGLSAIVAAPLAIPTSIIMGLGALGIGVTAAGYAISRGMAKSGAAVSETPPAK